MVASKMFLKAHIQSAVDNAIGALSSQDNSKEGIDGNMNAGALIAIFHALMRSHDFLQSACVTK